MSFKRLFGAFILLLMWTLSASAQDCPFHVQFKTIASTCYNDGKVVYALFDDGNNIMDSATTYIMHDFEQVRIYYVTDTTHYDRDYRGGWDTLTIDYGKYTIGVQASCGHVEYNKDTILNIDLGYTKPKAGALLTTATSDDSYGRHPTLLCQHTGRIQLKIEDGKLPFKVTMTNVGGDTIDTYIFTERGTSDTITKYNYKDYFTIDSLEAKTYKFYIVDGCGYGLPSITQKVDTLEFTKLDYVNVYASSGNFADNNVVKIKAVLNENYKPYYASLISKYAEYRFTHNGGLGSTAWRKFPKVTPSTKSVILYDTVPGAVKYCDIWENNINLEYKVTSCGSVTSTETFKIYKPSDSTYGYYFSKADTVTGRDADPSSYAKYKNNGRHIHGHWIHYVIRNGLYENAIKEVSKEENADSRNRFHYTHPLVWEYLDTTSGLVIKLDTVDNITSWSKIQCSDVIPKYRSFVDSALIINVQRTLRDGNGCVLYEVTGPLEFRYWAPGCAFLPQEWSYSYTNNDAHCRENRTIRFYGWNTSRVIKNGIKVSLIESPLGGFYNFDATYNATTKASTVQLSNEFNGAMLSFADNGALSVSISQPELPSGYYRFRFQYKYLTCSGDTALVDTTFKRIRFDFDDTYSVEMTVEPTFTYTQNCSALKFTYSTGGFRTVKSNTRAPSYESIVKDYSSNPAKFKIISGPDGGYDGNYYRVGDPIYVSLPGTYIVRMEPEKQYCDSIFYYDTVVNTGGTVSFDYAMAVLCDRDSTRGNIYVHAIEGTPPYTYTIFSEADKHGTVLKTETIYDGAVCIDSNQYMEYNKPLSCLVSDACGSYFHVNIYPSTLADMQKLWFDNGLSRDTVCRGSTITIHALKISNILSYEWEGPNGFTATSSDPEVFISDTTDGWYKVTIKGTGCADATDSIYLVINESPSLKIELTSNDSVCPGSDMLVHFIPSSPYTLVDSIDFTVAFANSNGIEYRSYRALHGDTITDVYSSATEAHIYSSNIYDGRCEYTVADDTVVLKISNKIANSCLMLTTDTSVCYNTGARLYAKSDLALPYVIRWYSDYELTHLLKEDSINSDRWSQYDTSNIVTKTFLYVQVDAAGYCPTVYGLPAQTLTMKDGADTTIVLKCGESYRLYDSGGSNKPTSSKESFTYHFVSEDGKPVAVHFDSHDMVNATMLVIGDSILYKVAPSNNLVSPGLIVSKGDTLTLRYMSLSGGSDWSAIVERSPGVAIADPMPQEYQEIVLNVCQSKVNTWMDSIGNPYNIVPDIVDSASSLDTKMRTAGNYYFKPVTLQKKVYPYCDSIVEFKLIVEPPQHYDTTVLITNMHGGSYTWPKTGETYTQSGKYKRTHTVANGCDSLDILNLIILQIDTSCNDMCVDSNTTMGITVKEPDVSWLDGVFSPKHKIGDVLTIYGEIMNPDTFLVKYPGQLPKGVVFYLDKSGQHGRAVALRDAHDDTCKWAKMQNSTDLAVAQHILALQEYNSFHIRDAIYDMNGYGNTLKIRECALTVDSRDFRTNAPAAYWCYYYDHTTLTTNTSLHQQWYLPAVGEIAILFANRETINSTLAKLRLFYANVRELDGQYWSSTSRAAPGTAWCHFGSTSYGFVGNGKYQGRNVRAVILF